MPRKKIDGDLTERIDKRVSARNRKEQDDLIESVLYRENQEITQPKRTYYTEKLSEKLPKILGSLILILLVGSFYFYINKNKSEDKKAEVWYAVKLVDGEMFYGKIGDIKSDPIVINNVYYNYDQLKAKEEGKPVEEPTANIRLVKRGKETHGPDGSLNVVRSQVLFLEAMKTDSKILKAIEQYENK